MPGSPALDSNALLKKLDSIATLSDDERDVINAVPIQIADIKADQDVVRAGDRPNRCCLIIKGFAAVYKILADGQRQISAFKIPGDIPDLHSLHLAELDSSLTTLTPCQVGFIRHDDVLDLCRRYPRLTHAFWRSTLIDAAVLREWVGNIGQRQGHARMAHLLCEMLVRLTAVGLADGHACEFPMSQTELADATGMSSVHVNRVLQDLRRSGLITLRDNRLVVLDWARLTETAGFSPQYLHLK